MVAFLGVVSVVAALVPVGLSVFATSANGRVILASTIPAALFA